MSTRVDAIKYSKAARNYIKSRTEDEKQDLKNFIEEHLGCYPGTGDIKPLRGYKDKRMRIRYGEIRIIYRYDKNGNVIILLILDIGSRGDIYK